MRHSCYQDAQESDLVAYAKLLTLRSCSMPREAKAVFQLEIANAYEELSARYNDVHFQFLEENRAKAAVTK